MIGEIEEAMDTRIDGMTIMREEMIDNISVARSNNIMWISLKIGIRTDKKLGRKETNTKKFRIEGM